MLDWLKIILCFVLDMAKPRSVLAAENAALRQQVIVLRRLAPKQLSLNSSDRILFSLIFSLFPQTKSAVHIVQPATLIRWHRMGFRALWRWKSRSRGGRPKVSEEIQDLIRAMSLANPLWGAPRIHGELKMLGINVAQSTVAKYIAKRLGPPSQGWITFLRNYTDGIASCDFLIVPTVGFKLLYAFVILGHGRRKLLHISVTAHPTAEWAARQICEAFPWDSTPAHLIRDNDAIYGAAFKKQLCVMGIRDGPTALRSPWQNGYVERVIGSLRRECLDHMIIRDENHLRRILKAYTKYYNAARTHLSLNKDAPDSRPVRRGEHVKRIPHLGGLHHEYIRI